MMSHFKAIGIYCICSSPFAMIIASTLLGMLSMSFWSVSVGIFAHSAKKAIAWSDTDAEQEGMIHNLHS